MFYALKLNVLFNGPFNVAVNKFFSFFGFLHLPVALIGLIEITGIASEPFWMPVFTTWVSLVTFTVSLSCNWNIKTYWTITLPFVKPVTWQPMKSGKLVSFLITLVKTFWIFSARFVYSTELGSLSDSVKFCFRTSSEVNIVFPVAQLKPLPMKPFLQRQSKE